MTWQRIWSPAECESLRQLCAAGTPRKQIASKLNRSIHSVWKKIEAMGLKSPKPETMKKRLRRLEAENAELREIIKRGIESH